MRIIGLAVAAVTTAFGVAHALSLEQLDTDGDGMLSIEEFAPAIKTANWFAQWNADGDDEISFDEFSTTLFDQYDDDRDGKLTREQWEQSFSDWPGDQAWSEWDDDGDGALSQDEFLEGLGARGLYAGLAGRDFTLSRSEFIGSIFDWYEGPDDDRLLSSAELEPLANLMARER